MVMASLAVVIMITPLIATAQACGGGGGWKKKSTETFTLNPTTDSPTIVGLVEIIAPTEKIVNDGATRIAWGALREYEYKGVLGEGTIYARTVYSISDWPLAGNAGKGHGIYYWTLVIDTDKGYGTGTLQGYAYLRWDFDGTAAPPRYEQWTNAQLDGKGDLSGMTVFLETYGTNRPPAPVWKEWFTKTTIISK